MMILSPTMKECLQFAINAGGKLKRFPGGYWCHPEARTHLNVTSFGTKTVEALVSRRVAKYTAFQDRKFGGEKFPIEITIQRHCRICFCVQERACAGGCSWVSDDCCSSCVEMVEI